MENENMKKEITKLQKTLDARFGEPVRKEILAIFAEFILSIEHPYDKKRSVGNLADWIKHRETYYITK